MNLLWQILIALRSVRPFLTTEATLLAQVRVSVAQSTTTTEFKTALADGEAKGLVIGQRDSIEKDVIRWKITDLGLTALAERNL